jgi:HEAT repeat protein
MGARTLVPVVAVSVFFAMGAHGAASGPEPYWGSRPLSFWIAALSADDPELRERAARSVGSLAAAHGGPAVAAALPGLTENLGAAEPPVREAAAGALEQMGPTARPAAPVLLRMFTGDESLAVRRRAGLALGRVDPSSREVVTEATRVLRAEEHAGVRASAAILLSAGGAAAAPAVPALETALDDSDAHVQLYAAAALANQGQRARATPVLLTLLNHEDGAVRAEAAALLPAVAPKKTDVVTPLTAALKDPDAEVRAAAAGSLGTLGRAARSALRPLWLLLHDSNETVRERVALAMAAINR